MPLDLRLWLASFVFLTAVGFVIQLGILPYLVPSLHAGDGLIANTDSVTFHRAAVRISERISQSGWQNWDIRPEAWGHVGISSAMYALFTPKPWILVPIAAALISVTVVLLLHVLLIIGLEQHIAAPAALVILALPSTAILTTQWHKDQIAIPSTLAMIMGCLLLWQGQRMVAGAISIVVGVFGLWLVRDHIIQVMAGASLAGAVACAVTTPWSSVSARYAFLRLLIGAIGVAILAHSIPTWTDKFQVPEDQFRSRSQQEDRSAISVPHDPTPHEREPVPVDKEAAPPQWSRSRWIPTSLDRRFANLAQVREVSKRGTGHGCSSIETDVTFSDAATLLRYTPRAAAVMLFSPIPSRWLSTACAGGGRMLSLIAGAEMLIAYCAFLGLPILLWRLRRQSSVWFLCGLCVVALIVHGIIFMNVGTIFRIRYAWFTTLIVLGAAGWTAVWRRGQPQDLSGTGLAGAITDA